MLNNSNQIKLPRLVSDGMVLQRNAMAKIWGWAAAGVKVKVKFLGKSYISKADADGKWTVIISTFDAGGPYNMEIKAENETITLKNILTGDVWICSGQSNMVLPMTRVNDLYADEIAHSENSAIRQFIVPDSYDFNEPQQDLQSGSWEWANPTNVLAFSAAGYFFAKALFEKYHVPIGLIKTCTGGSPVEAWMSGDVLAEFPVYLAMAEKLKDAHYVDQIRKEDESLNVAWYSQLNRQDKGLAAGEKPWFDEECDVSAWKTMKLPAFWDDEGLGNMNGVVWFRKKIIVPVSMTNKPARLLLGRIVDCDFAYVNGVFVGTISYQYPPRKYDIPENLLKAGENIIVIRVINVRSRGGFIKDKPYKLIAGDEILDLTGEWQYAIGAVADPLPEPTFFQYKPLGLYNGMTAPLLNYAIKGCIWYQGESNTSKHADYRELFSAMIADWRKKWNQGDFPFLYVQLANYMQAESQPCESDWAALREAQLQTLAVPNTAMVVATDIGEWNDLHPLNKKDVGNRLALAAQKLAYYDNDVINSGPVYHSMKIEGNKIIATFTNTGGGLAARGGELKHFAVAGSDRKFVWAKAEINDDKVIVWNDRLLKPVYIRYAWADNPEGANLYNREGLPASSFRTDE
jgi:sialate O-acetylesterase